MRLVPFCVGYLGLVTGPGMSELGHDVLCVDIDPERVQKLKDGVLPIYEPGLADLVKRNERSGRLHFSVNVDPPYDEAEIYFIAVGTPLGPDGAPDTSAVFAASDRIADLGKKPAVVA